MKAIILAAGYGKRLQPLTDNCPKCLIEVNGTSLIEASLESLSSVNVDEVLIVTGHMREKIINTLGFSYKGINLQYIHNKHYKTTNNVYSLWLTRDYVDSDVLLLECDLYYDSALLRKLLECDAECAVLTSNFDPDKMDGSVVITDENMKGKALVLKRDQGEKFNYSSAKKTINIYKFSKEFFMNKYMPAIDLYVKTQSVNSYYELVLGSLMYYGNSNIEVVNVPSDLWCEIDDIKDLERAKQIDFNRY